LLDILKHMLGKIYPISTFTSNTILSIYKNKNHLAVFSIFLQVIPV